MDPDLVATDGTTVNLKAGGGAFSHEVAGVVASGGREDVGVEHVASLGSAVDLLSHGFQHVGVRVHSASLLSVFSIISTKLTSSSSAVNSPEFCIEAGSSWTALLSSSLVGCWAGVWSRRPSA